MILAGKNVLVFGLGKSGISTSNLILAVGGNPVLYDGKKDLNKEEIQNNIIGKVNIHNGDFNEKILQGIELVVVSPGVPLDIEPFNIIKNKGIQVIGEVELAYEMSKGEIVAITGTNGKTTTTALVGKILQDYFNSVFIVGNIGVPFTERALLTGNDSKIALEISSFQLETIKNFHPKVSAILNITPDHLNRHHTMEEYIRVKELITLNQDENDFCILNYNDKVLRDFGKTISPKVIYFSSEEKVPYGYYYNNGKIFFTEEPEAIIDEKEINIIGKHNMENVMAAIAMTKAIGVPMDSILSSVREFKAVAHRIEYVTEKNGVAFYNDSKGTNPDAAIKAIEAMTRPTLLIGGGYDKDSSYDQWINSFNGKVKELVLIGQTKDKIKACAEKNGFTNITLCNDLTEAVKLCYEHSKEGDCVLLSPACASWGQFDNYEQRGDLFKELVRGL